MAIGVTGVAIKLSAKSSFSVLLTFDGISLVVSELLAGPNVRRNRGQACDLQPAVHVGMQIGHLHHQLATGHYRLVQIPCRLVHVPPTLDAPDYG